jgi:hypothetical protein
MVAVSKERSPRRERRDMVAAGTHRRDLRRTAFILAAFARVPGVARTR